MEMWSTDTTGKDFLLFGLALWGAGLSTYTFISGRRIRLRLSFSMLYDGDRHWIRVTATNAGSRPVTITYLTIALPGKGTLVPGQGLSDTKLPIALSDGEMCIADWPAPVVTSAMKRAGFDPGMKIYPEAHDSMGKIHRGKPQPFGK